MTLKGEEKWEGQILTLGHRIDIVVNSLSFKPVVSLELQALFAASQGVYRK